MRTAVAAMTALLACAVQSAAPAPKFDANRAYEDLRQQVAFGPRPAGSAALQQTRDYIKKQLVAAGLKPEEQPFECQTPIAPIHMRTIRPTLPAPSTAPLARPTGLSRAVS